MSGIKIGTARILTGIGYVLLAAAAVYFGGYAALAICFVIASFVLFDAVEALRKAGIRPLRITAYITAVAALPMYLIKGLGGVFCIFAISVIITLCIAVFSKQRTFRDIVFTLFLYMYPILPSLMFVFITAYRIQENNRIFLMMMFLLPSACDVFALLFGMAWGKRKLCPAISPQKTVAGCIGSFVGGTLAGLVSGMIINAFFTDIIPLYHYVLLGFASGFFSQVGDLSASMLKRFCGIKDFGKYLPGHGGMLDRFDSAIVVAVWIFFYMEIILG